MTKEKVYWKMRNGNLISVDDMDNEFNSSQHDTDEYDDSLLNR